MEIAASVRATGQTPLTGQAPVTSSLSGHLTAQTPVTPSLSDPPGLPLPSSQYNIKLTNSNLLSLLPKLSIVGTSHQMYRTLIDRIYSKLCKQPFLKSSSGKLCAPFQLLAVHQLAFNPNLYIPEDILFACTGKRYVDPLELMLDDELMGSLHITHFDCDTILTCVESTMRDGSLSISTLAGMLLALDR